MKERIAGILKEYWGYDRFRPLQEEIILSVLNKQDTLALLPTGGGKSLCYQIPALAGDGLCLVISPLIALMNDQVENLRRRNIKAAAIHSGMSAAEIETTLDNILFDPEYKLLYVSPERLKTSLFKANLSRMNISLIAVDEAHCISQWGYDFRPPYLEIANIRPFFPKIPVLALTATATSEVVKDIQAQLKFKKENIFLQSFRRENLTYFVVKEEDKHHRMLRIMERNPGTGIIYVRNRRKTQEISDFLNRQGITATFYHAGLDSVTRNRKQKDWMENKIRVMVCTNAFGMGIDKPDVRFVIHLDIPDTLEAYFQEAGRGGRDGKPSMAVMLYDDHDIRELKQNFELSYPSMETIRKIYQNIHLFYHNPVGSGAYSCFPFHAEEVAQYCEVKPAVLYNTLSFLERAGIMTLSEGVKKPSEIHVKLKSGEFRKFYQDHPSLEEFFQLLLRSYNGLFSNFVKINEEHIAKRMNTSGSVITDKLLQLKKYGAIEYIQGTHKPQIQFLENRFPEDYLYLYPDIYKRRKSVAQKKLTAVLDFINDTNKCHSCFLLAYFGEKKSQPCGKCDICLRQRTSGIKKAEYESIVSAIESRTGDRRWSARELVSELSRSFAEEEIVKVIRWLIDHGKLSLKD